MSKRAPRSRDHSPAPSESGWAVIVDYGPVRQNTAKQSENIGGAS
jgi:hypothetical protein